MKTSFASGQRACRRCVLLLAGIVALVGHPATLSAQPGDAERKAKLDEAKKWQEAGTAFAEKGDWKAAVAAGDKLLALHRQLNADVNVEFADLLNLTAGWREALEDWPAARAERLEALKLVTERFARYPDRAWRVTDVRLALADGDRLAAMKPDERQAVRRATDLIARGMALLEEGKLIDAHQRLVDGHALRKKLWGEDHRLVVESTYNLALLYMTMGEHAKSLAFATDAAERGRKVFGANHPKTAYGINALGALYSRMGKYDKAAAAFEEARKMLFMLLGPDHPEHMLCESNLGAAHLALGNKGIAELCLNSALRWRRRVLGNSHPDVAYTLSDLAAVHLLDGKYDRAVALTTEALAIVKNALGAAHPRYAGLQQQLAEIHQLMGDAPKAEPLLAASLVTALDELSVAAGVQTEQGQFQLLGARTPCLGRYLTVSLANRSPAARVYSFALRWKGQVFLRQLRQRELDQLADAPEAAAFRTASRQLATAALQSPPPAELEAWKKRVADLNEEKERLESALARRSAPFREQRQREQMTPEQLRKALPAKSALVDFLVYQHYLPAQEGKGRWDGGDHLVAFVVRPDRDVVRVDFGPLEPFREAIDRWRTDVKKPLSSRPDAKDAAAVLAGQLWQPLAKHLDGVDMVLLSPDGDLAKLPFGALPGSKPGTYLIEEVGIALVPVAQAVPDLVKPNRPAEGSLLVVGDVDYDAPPGKNTVPGVAVATAAGERGGDGATWKRLPATKDEAEAIRTIFEKQFGKGPINSLFGANAAEDVLRIKSPGARYLHFATHGYFAPPAIKSVSQSDSDHKSVSISVREMTKQHAAGYHPGLLAGLVLAGANRKPEPDADDGILTAVEVAALDLRRCELAVLSACETGLGQSAGGEGVLGLQRAFQVAGAKSVIASLWTVPDEPTRVLMERFYGNLWEGKMSKLDALRQAQRWMLTEGKTQPGVARGLVRDDAPQPLKDGRLPPYYWAAFVLSGDWR